MLWQELKQTNWGELATVWDEVAKTAVPSYLLKLSIGDKASLPTPQPKSPFQSLLMGA